MAGWKLRKDKTSSETPDTETPEGEAPNAEASYPEAPGVDFEEDGPARTYDLGEPEETKTPAFLDSVPHFSSLDSEPEVHFTDLDFDSDPEHGSDGPLTLVDYTEPEDAPAPQEFSLHGAQIFEMPPPAFEMPPPAIIEAAPPVIEALPPVTEEAPEDDFPERLRTGRFEPGELAPAPAFGFGIPTVSPFVLDTPPASAPAAAPPQLVVHVGRLSAPFALAKDVTTIGRPDSGLHYYPDVEIELDDAVSRRHAEVINRDGSYFLADTGSTNGTLLNGEKLPPHEERPLAYGDRIRVGDRTEITFE